MNKSEFLELFEKYFEGETSPEEEKKIKDFALKSEIEEAQVLKKLFEYFENGLGDEVVPEFDFSFLERKEGLVSKAGKYLRTAKFAIAAVFLLGLGLFFFNENRAPESKMNRERELAYAKLEKAFSLSAKGLEALNRALLETKRSEREALAALEKLKLIEKYNDFVIEKLERISNESEIYKKRGVSNRYNRARRVDRGR